MAVPYHLPWGPWVLLRRDGTAFGLLDGTYPEQQELDLVQAILKPGMVFFDAGANEGLYSLVAAGAVGEAGKVYAFEPVPSELRKLRSNVRVNRLKNVVVVDKAVGANDGFTKMHACEPLKGGFSSIARPSDYLNLKWEIIEVPIVTLDTFVDQAGIGRIDYLKIDVEGGERDVIAGAEGILTGEARPIVQVEFADGRTAQWNYDARELATRLTDLGYVLFECCNGGIIRHQIRKHYTAENLTAIPQERASQLQDLIVAE